MVEQTKYLAAPQRLGTEKVEWIQQKRLRVPPGTPSAMQSIGSPMNCLVLTNIMHTSSTTNVAR